MDCIVVLKGSIYSKVMEVENDTDIKDRGYGIQYFIT